MKSTAGSLLLLAVPLLVVAPWKTSGFVCRQRPSATATTTRRASLPSALSFLAHRNGHHHHEKDDLASTLTSTLTAWGLSAVLSVGTLLGGASVAQAAMEAARPTTTTTTYSGFADYAKENQMQQSDVSCFVTKCGDQTKALFSNPRGIKGTTCLGQCKGEQACATRCFAQYGSEDLSNWLSCAIEEQECVKIPKGDFDNSADNVGYTSTVQKFDPTTLIGKWYKTDGLNPNYDLFDCQYNTFDKAAPDASELDMGIFFRVQRPPEVGGGYWENALTEHMVVDALQARKSDTPPRQQPGERTMHTQGKMNGLQFDENWFILGESDGSNGVPPFKLVAYKGHTLQGGYEGSFVYSREPRLPEAAIPAVREAAERAGLKWDDYQRIDNTCPTGNILNDDQAGTGTSTQDWINLVVGEGGVIDWISPGWRGEYRKS